MRQLIFENKKLKSWLESTIILKEMQSDIKRTKSPYCLLVIPLLLEKNLQYMVNRILVIDTLKKYQIERVKKRDGIFTKGVQNIIQNQVSQKIRKSQADDIIINNGILSDLKKKVELLHYRYLELSKNNFNSLG